VLYPCPPFANLIYARAMRRSRLIAFTALLAASLTIASSCFERVALRHVASFDGCVPNCPVVVAGYPFAFIADDLGISPGNSATLTGVLMGVDRMLWPEFLASFACWLIVGAVVVMFWHRSRHGTQSKA
jgi:hypothetical protein